MLELWAGGYGSYVRKRRRRNFSRNTRMLTIDQLIDLEEKARALIAELEAAVARSGEDTAAVAPDAAIGRISRMDSMQQQQMAKAGVRRMQARVAALHDVLRQMEGGDYGMCLKCGEDIECERLESAPEMKLCGKCSAAAG